MPPKQVHRQRRHALGDFRREDLADRRFGEERLAGVAQARRVVDGEPRGFDVDRRARELVLHGLELGDRLAELLPLLRVLDGVIERAARQADHLRADADASLVQRFDGRLVALADLAEHVGLRARGSLREMSSHVLLARIPSLSSFLPTVKPANAALDDERGDAAIARLGIHRREDQEDVRLVPLVIQSLRPVSDVAVAVRRSRAGRQRKRVAARARLRQRVGADACRPRASAGSAA